MILNHGDDTENGTLRLSSASNDKPGNVTPLRQRPPVRPPRPVDRCRHGVPLDLDCAECHGIKPDDKGDDQPA